MLLKKYILCGLFAASLTAFTGCDDLFRDTPVDKMSEKDIWKNPCFWTNMSCHGTGT